jgi:hypothetical protein
MCTITCCRLAATQRPTSFFGKSAAAVGTKIYNPRLEIIDTLL